MEGGTQERSEGRLWLIVMTVNFPYTHCRIILQIKMIEHELADDFPDISITGNMACDLLIE
jgi:hypothetical protein